MKGHPSGVVAIAGSCGGLQLGELGIASGVAYSRSIAFPSATCTPLAQHCGLPTCQCLLWSVLVSALPVGSPWTRLPVAESRSEC